VNTSGHRRHGLEPEAPADKGSPVRTLIVDDSPLVVKTLALLLEQQSDVQLIGSASAITMNTPDVISTLAGTTTCATRTEKSQSGRTPPA
jgi:hypothetical protein